MKQNMDKMKERQKRRRKEGGKKGKERKENCVVMQSLEFYQEQEIPFTISQTVH